MHMTQGNAMGGGLGLATSGSSGSGGRNVGEERAMKVPAYFCKNNQQLN